MKRKTKRLFLLCALMLALPHATYAQPESLHPDVSIRQFKLVGAQSIRIAYNPADGLLYYLQLPGESSPSTPSPPSASKSPLQSTTASPSPSVLPLPPTAPSLWWATRRAAATISASSCAAN